MEASAAQSAGSSAEERVAAAAGALAATLAATSHRRGAGSGARPVNGRRGESPLPWLVMHSVPLRSAVAHNMPPATNRDAARRRWQRLRRPLDRHDERLRRQQRQVAYKWRSPLRLRGWLVDERVGGAGRCASRCRSHLRRVDPDQLRAPVRVLWRRELPPRRWLYGELDRLSRMMVWANAPNRPFATLAQACFGIISPKQA